MPPVNFVLGESVYHVAGAFVVVLITQGGHFACLWAGDSRAYQSGRSVTLSDVAEGARRRLFTLNGAVPNPLLRHGFGIAFKFIPPCKPTG